MINQLCLAASRDADLSDNSRSLLLVSPGSGASAETHRSARRRQKKKRGARGAMADTALTLTLALDWRAGVIDTAACKQTVAAAEGRNLEGSLETGRSVNTGANKYRLRLPPRGIVEKTW
ncbi:hypothetical protein J6590_095772 [Homalodisca vitripennis]|nr:hypothetical protein J6590_095772 [Homalodisca vitripennis]